MSDRKIPNSVIVGAVLGTAVVYALFAEYWQFIAGSGFALISVGMLTWLLPAERDYRQCLRDRARLAAKLSTDYVGEVCEPIRKANMDFEKKLLKRIDAYLITAEAPSGNPIMRVLHTLGDRFALGHETKAIEEKTAFYAAQNELLEEQRELYGWQRGLESGRFDNEEELKDVEVENQLEAARNKKELQREQNTTAILEEQKKQRELRYVEPPKPRELSPEEKIEKRKSEIYSEMRDLDEMLRNMTGSENTREEEKRRIQNEAHNRKRNLEEELFTLIRR